MIRSEENIARNLDWIAVGFYILFVFLGWLNIYAVVYDPEAASTIFDFSINSGKQLMWIGGSALIVITVMVIDFKFYSTFAYFFYGASIFLLILTIALGTVVNGSHSWLDLGFVRVQPAEFAKFATALALAKYLGDIHIRIERVGSWIIPAAGMIILPCIIILLQNETGSMLVFSAFVLVLFREGLPGTLLLLGVYITTLFVLTLGIGTETPVNEIEVGSWTHRLGIQAEAPVMIGVVVLFILIFIYIFLNRTRISRKQFMKQIIMIVISCVLSLGFIKVVHKIFFDVLQEHQRNRIMVLFDTELDTRGVGYHVHQSKIAIGSGDFFGKGFLEGTQTKFDFVPEQSTDFIFCTIGEEHGWFGSTILIILYVGFMMRLVFIAERQKDRFARIYGYSVTCIIFFHFMVNIGMTIGIFPVIGIPLPFFSYGGSSLWSFTLLLFVFLKLDAHRGQVLGGH